jgi:hypothetical protein
MRISINGCKMLHPSAMATAEPPVATGAKAVPSRDAQRFPLLLMTHS